MPPLAQIPALTFASPSRQPDPPPEQYPEAGTTLPHPSPSPEESQLPLDAPPEPPGPARNARGAIRTATSSPGDDGPKVDPKIAGRVAATVIGALLVVAGWMVSRRQGWELRQPSDAELAGMGDPLGRIAGRHLPQGIVNADLLDAADFADGVRRYVAPEDRAPLLVPTHAQPVEPDPYA